MDYVVPENFRQILDGTVYVYDNARKVNSYCYYNYY